MSANTAVLTRLKASSGPGLTPMISWLGRAGPKLVKQVPTWWIITYSKCGLFLVVSTPTKTEDCSFAIIYYKSMWTKHLIAVGRSPIDQSKEGRGYNNADRISGTQIRNLAFQKSLPLLTSFRRKLIVSGKKFVSPNFICDFITVLQTLSLADGSDDHPS